MVTSASKQMSTRRRASRASVVPQWLNSGPRPPNVPAPKLSAGTFSPEAPQRAGLVESRRIGQWTYYRRNDARISQLPSLFGSTL